MDIVIFGSGNVAYSLGRALVASGCKVLQVVGRNVADGSELATALGASFTTSFHQLMPADIYIVCVTDMAIAPVLASIGATDGIVVHTSGSTAMDKIPASFVNRGVFYPFQTFTKGKLMSFSNIPICIEASNDYTAQKLNDLAQMLTSTVLHLTSEQRSWLHIAAVFACNYVNHLYAIAHEITASHNIPFDILHPLILETAQKIATIQPQLAQTGPAVRGDSVTVNKHLKMLESNADVKDLYQLLATRIEKMR